MPDENQPQVEEAAVVETPVEVPQVEETPVVETPGAEKVEEAEKPSEIPKERTYSQEEVGKIQAASDKKVADIQKQLYQRAMQEEIAKQEQSERETSANDRKAVDDGLITSDEANQRKGIRTQQLQTSRGLMQQQQVLGQMRTEAEALGKTLAARDLGKEYDLNDKQITELIADKDVKSPADMKAKAASLANERLRDELKKVKSAPQKFDSGQSSMGGGELPKTAKGLMKAGWEEISKK